MSQEVNYGRELTDVRDDRTNYLNASYGIKSWLLTKDHKRIALLYLGSISLRDLALALWLGGLIVIDFVETPTRFRVKAINRNQVAAVGREVFAALNCMETIVGALLLIVSVLIVGRAPLVTYKSQAALISVGLMWLVALTQYFWARPRMSKVTKGLDLVKRRQGDARFDILRRWHKTYVALDLAKMALGLAAFGLWI